MNLIRLTDVMARTALSRSGIYDLMARKRFPNPVKIGGGRINAWPESEIDDWIAERISERVSWKSNSPAEEALQ
jgi:prophage regulatory protein